MLHRLKVEESETDSISTTDSQLSSDLERASLDGRHASTSSAQDSVSSNGSGATGFPLSLPLHHSSGSSVEEKKNKDDGLARWLRDGTVVYKSVGLGLMDLVVGMELVRLAKEKGVGTRIPGF